MIKVIETSNLPIVLKTLKEKKYFYDDSVLISIREEIKILTTTTNNHDKVLNSLTEKSSIEILPLTESNGPDGYIFNLCSDMGTETIDKKIIATGTLYYDAISNSDVTDIINEVDASIK